MKRKLLIALVVVLVPVLGFMGMMASTFAGLAPVLPTTELPGGAIGVADGYVQAFILPLGDGVNAALIDCGNDPEAKVLKAKLAELKLTVTHIFLTHGHPDHVNGCLAFPGAEIYAMTLEQPLVEGAVAAKGPLPKMMKSDPAKCPKVTHPLRDGEVVQVGNIAVSCYLIPGHTGGSAAYLSLGSLFFGDAVSGQADGKLRNAPWMFSDDTAQCRQSVAMLGQRLQAEKVEVKTLVFAHSGPLPGMGPLLAF